MTGSTPEEERACRPARPNTAQADAFSRPDVGDRPQAPTTPLGFDELSVAGGLRGKPAELVECLTVAQKAIARAEIVVEGEIQPGKRVVEDQNSGIGKAMPEFPGTHPRTPDAQCCPG
jgi:3-octaprenyl-4-hydroxybenzoate carboxy-lyase